MHNAQMMSNQVLCSNVAASKFRGHAIDGLLERNQLSAPDMFNNLKSKVKSYSVAQQAYGLNDYDAEEAFKCAKASRSKLTKNKK